MCVGETWAGLAGSVSPTLTNRAVCARSRHGGPLVQPSDHHQVRTRWKLSLLGVPTPHTNPCGRRHHASPWVTAPALVCANRSSLPVFAMKWLRVPDAMVVPPPTKASIASLPPVTRSFFRAAVHRTMGSSRGRKERRSSTGQLWWPSTGARPQFDNVPWFVGPGTPGTNSIDRTSVIRQPGSGLR